jgi:hypothetical protein
VAKLLLVNPQKPSEVNTNISLVADFIVNAIPNPMASGVIRVSEISIDLIELWYWFDPIHGSHRLAFWGDFPAGLFAAETTNQLHFRYFFYPFALFGVVTGLYRVPVKEPPPPRLFDRLRSAIDALILAIPSPPVDEYEATRFEDSLAAEFGDPQCVTPQANASGLENEDDGDVVSPDDEEWTAILALLKYFDRVPVVSVSRAAILLGVDERTIRNRISRRELEAIPRRGTIWVTKQSIKSYVKKHYYPTSEFDMWSKYVEPRLRKSLVIMELSESASAGYLQSWNCNHSPFRTTGT